MKILNLMYSKNPSAAAVHMIHREICSAYEACGHSVDTLFLIGEGENSFNLDRRLLKNRGWKKLYYWLARKKIEKFIKDNDYDIILCDGISIMGMVLQLSSQNTNTTYIAVMHGYVSIPQWMLKELKKPGSLWHCVGVSEQIGEYLENTYSTLKRFKSFGINNGLDFDAIANGALSKNIAKAQLGIKENELVIGAIARLESEKEPDVLLQAFAHFYRKEGTGILLLVGTGQMQNSLKDMAAQLGITDRVVFAGFLPNAAQYLPAIDLYAACSRHEGLSISVLEALACKVPVICADIPAFSNVICDGRMRFGIGDFAAAGDLMIQFVKDANLFSEIVENLSVNARKNLSIEKMRSSYVELLKSIA